MHHLKRHTASMHKGIKTKQSVVVKRAKASPAPKEPATVEENVIIMSEDTGTEAEYHINGQVYIQCKSFLYNIFEFVSID